MCISIQHTLKEELRNMQAKSKLILQKQEKKLRNMGKVLEQIQVTCVFILHEPSIPECKWHFTDRHTFVQNRRRCETHKTTVRASWPASSTPSRDITFHWGSWSRLRGRRQRLRFRSPSRPCRWSWRKWGRGVLSWIVWHRLTTMSISCRYTSAETLCLNLYKRWCFHLSASSPLLCPHRGGPLCSASTKKTSSVLSERFPRIHSSPSSLQRETLNSSGRN